MQVLLRALFRGPARVVPTAPREGPAGLRVFGCAAAAALFLVTPRPAWTQCEISGPTEVCGSPIELCAPHGSIHEWSGPGVSAGTQCIEVSQPGEYTVRFFDPINGLWFGPCSQIVTGGGPGCEGPREPQACPRPPSWWLRSCSSDRGGALSAADMEQISRRVDEQSDVVDASRSAGLCNVLRARHNLRARARRHVAAVWASVVAGELGIPGTSVSLPRTTVVELPGVRTTVGEWLAGAEQTLASLERSRLRDRSVKQAYREIVRTGWHIDHGMGMGTTCGLGKPTGLTEDANPAREMSDEGLSLDMNVASSGRSTSVHFALESDAAAEDVSISVFDVAGRRIADLASGNYPPGEHRVEWDGRLPDGARARSGVYFVRGRVRDQVTETRMTVLR